jgi:sugar (pentulose or hexulose) kinase
VLADESCEPVGPALAYDDARAVAEAARAQEVGRERWESIGLRIAPSFSLAKLAWLAARDGGLDGAAHAWSGADLVVARLLGRAGPTDWSHALKGGYDLVRREWPVDVYEALGVPPSVLPPVRPPASAAGRVCADAAAETGLPAGCEVRLGMTDGCAAQLAAGAVVPGRYVGVLGTTLVIKGVSTELVHDPTGAVYSHLHPDGSWLPGGASNTGGEALARFGAANLAELDRLAARRGPARCVTYPLARTGERFPFLEPAAEGFTVRDPADETEAYRAALEGVAFVERLAHERLATLGAPAEGPMATAGAASRSAVWNRIRATVLDRVVVVPATPTSAFGAALLAAAGTLHEDLASAARAMVSHVDEVEPDRRERAGLDDSYARFTDELAKRGWITAVEPAGATG